MAEPGDPPGPRPDPGEAALLDRFAPYYDLEYAGYDDDLDFYRHWAARAAPEAGGGARVLDLACGSGRVLRALAGHQCTGVDASPAMLALARASTAGLPQTPRLVTARMQALPAGLGPFDLALCALNSFAYLPTQADQLAMLSGVRTRLAPSGLLVLDLTPLEPPGPYPANGELVHQSTWSRSDGGQILKFVSGHWDPAEQQHHVTWIYDTAGAGGEVQRTVIPQTLRYTYRWEAQLLLERAGFRLTAVYGSYDLDPYASGAPRLILVAQAAAAG